MTGYSNRTTSNLETYGFFPDDNPSDAVYLDDIILQQLTENEKDNLELRQFYGYASPQYERLLLLTPRFARNRDYQITPTGASTHVEAVACMKYMDHEKWLSYILGESDEGVDQQKTAEIICGWIATYLRECKTAVENIDDILAKGLDSGYREKISTVKKRWVQIERLCQDAIGVIRASEDDEDS